MISHDAEGQDPNLKGSGQLKHQRPEEILLGVAEEELAVDDAGDAMVDGGWNVILGEPVAVPHTGIT